MDPISQLFFLKEGSWAPKAEAQLATPPSQLLIPNVLPLLSWLPLHLQNEGAHRLGSHVLHVCFPRSVVILELVSVHLVLVIHASVCVSHAPSPRTAPTPPKKKKRYTVISETAFPWCFTVSQCLFCDSEKDQTDCTNSSNYFR